MMEPDSFMDLFEEYSAFEIFRISLASTILGKKLWRKFMAQMKWKDGR